MLDMFAHLFKAYLCAFKSKNNSLYAFTLTHLSRIEFAILIRLTPTLRAYLNPSQDIGFMVNAHGLRSYPSQPARLQILDRIVKFRLMLD